MEVISLEMPCLLVLENLDVYLLMLILSKDRSHISWKISTNKATKPFRILPLYYYNIPNIFQKSYTNLERTEKIKNNLYAKCDCAVEGMLWNTWFLLTHELFCVLSNLPVLSDFCP